MIFAIYKAKKIWYNTRVLMKSVFIGGTNVFA